MNRLRGLQIGRVDLVDKGAAINPRITLFKRRVEKTMNLDQILAGLPDDQRNVIMQAIQSAGQAAVAQDGADDEVGKDLSQGTGGPDQTIAEQDPNDMTQSKAAPPPAAKPGAAAPAGQVGAPPQKKPNAIPAAKRLELPDDVRKKLEEHDDLKARVAKMERDDRRREMVEKARKVEKGAVGLSLDDTATLIDIVERSVEKRSAPVDLAKKLGAHFRSVKELLEKHALFGEIGSNGIGASGSSAHDKISAIAKQRSKDEKISFSKAYKLTLQEQPELYHEYENENPTAVLAGAAD